MANMSLLSQSQTALAIAMYTMHIISLGDTTGDDVLRYDENTTNVSRTGQAACDRLSFHKQN